MTDSWRLALGTLTAVPVRPPGTVDRDTARTAMLLAPLAALPLGLVVLVVGVLGRWLGLPPLLVAVLALGGVVAGNRAMHLDGLADTVDGLAASYDPERSLAVMKSGTSGPAGVAAIVLVLGAQAAGLAPLLTTTSGTVLAGLALCVSRGALSLCCLRGVPSARPDGLGVLFAQTVPRSGAALLWLVAAAVLAGVGATAGPAWWSGLVGVGCALVVVGLLLRHVVRRLGGVTGDVFGAAVELAWPALLVGLLVSP
ncbi:MAG TPA: adenosylcobinamide-GDP ribazoletransferase [Marmoricola sp.]|nr:adenosylcobinamide-GDP ribazoletransferase [Marmoricola sp.]